MRRCVLGFAFTSIIAMGQEPVREAPKLEAYRAKALENALRQPNSSSSTEQKLSFSLVPGRTISGIVFPGPVQTTCAIPLTTLRADPAIDPHIERKLNPGAFAMDNMPQPKAMPVCAK